MVTRRNLLVGSASTVAVGTLGPASIAAAARSAGRAAEAAQTRLAADGFALPFGLFCPVPYLSRAAWGADESLAANNGVYWPEEWFTPQTLSVHHTGFAPAPNPADTVRDIFQRQTLHGDGTTGGGEGWGDIGYHLLIDSNGVVYEGRRSGNDAYPVFDTSGYYMATGAHIYGYNTGNIGVCLVGYYNDSPPSQAAQDSLVTVLAYLAAVARINPTGTVNYRNPVNGNTHTGLGVSGHRDWAATDCPGNPTFYGQLGSIRQRVAAAVPALPTPTQTQTTTQPPQTTQPPTTTTEPPQTGDPTGTGQPTQTTVPTQTTATQPPADPQPPPPPPPPPGGQNGTPHEERGGGDEYVDVAREEQPDLFPTVAPSASASPSPTSTPTPHTSGAPVARASQTAAASVASGAGGFGWGVTAAAAVGVAAVGAAVGGLVWLRQRRTTVAAAGSGLTVVDEPTVVAEPTVVDEPTVVAESTVVEKPTVVAEPTSVDEPTSDGPPVEPSSVDEPAADGDSPDDASRN